MSPVNTRHRWLTLTGLCALALAANACSGDSEASGTGGRAGGSGGAGGSSSSTVTYLLTFDTAADVDKVTAANVIAADAAVPAGELTPTTVKSHDSAAGQPAANGSLKIVAPFTGYMQSVDYQVIIEPQIDLTGKVLSMWIRLDSGFTPDPSAPGGMIFYAKSGTDWAWGQGAWTNIAVTDIGIWKEVKFDMRFPDPGTTATFVTTSIRAVGFKIDSGTPLTTVAMPTAATFHIDSIGYGNP
jgi:hypothetical protein